LLLKSGIMLLLFCHLGLKCSYVNESQNMMWYSTSTTHTQSQNLKAWSRRGLQYTVLVYGTTETSSKTHNDIATGFVRALIPGDPVRLTRWPAVLIHEAWGENQNWTKLEFENDVCRSNAFLRSDKFDCALPVICTGVFSASDRAISA